MVKRVMEIAIDANCPKCGGYGVAISSGKKYPTSTIVTVSAKFCNCVEFRKNEIEKHE